MPDDVQPVRLDQVFDGGLTLFGQPLAPAAISMMANSAITIAPLGTPLTFAQIRAFRYISGFCTKLPIPVILAVPGQGKALTEPECDFKPGEVLKWMVPFDVQTVAIQVSKGSVDALLTDLATRGIDGGIELRNPRLQGTKACVDVHVWAKIEFLGQKVHFDESFPVCVDLGCFTVWEIGWANLQVCFQAPNQLCGKVCVGKWGIEKCWQQCVSIPWTASETTQPSPCPKCC